MYHGQELEYQYCGEMGEKHRLNNDGAIEESQLIFSTWQYVPITISLAKQVHLCNAVA